MLNKIYNAYYFVAAMSGAFWEGYCCGRSEAIGEPLRPPTNVLLSKSSTSPWYLGRLIVRVMH